MTKIQNTNTNQTIIRSNSYQRILLNDTSFWITFLDNTFFFTDEVCNRSNYRFHRCWHRPVSWSIRLCVSPCVVLCKKSFRFHAPNDTRCTKRRTMHQTTHNAPNDAQFTKRRTIHQTIHDAPNDVIIFCEGIGPRCISTIRSHYAIFRHFTFPIFANTTRANLSISLSIDGEILVTGLLNSPGP